MSWVNFFLKQYMFSYILLHKATFNVFLFWLWRGSILFEYFSDKTFEKFEEDLTTVLVSVIKCGFEISTISQNIAFCAAIYCSVNTMSDKNGLKKKAGVKKSNHGGKNKSKKKKGWVCFVCKGWLVPIRGTERWTPRHISPDERKIMTEKKGGKWVRWDNEASVINWTRRACRVHR